MPKITSNTIVKNGEDFIEMCLNSILPYVETAIVSIDKSSTDKTTEILTRMAAKNKKIELDFFEVDNFRQLTSIRNQQLRKSKGDWIWIVDDDEYYMEKDLKVLMNELDNTDKDAVAVFRWFILPDNRCHTKISKGVIERLFRNKPTMEWRGKFQFECVYDGKDRMWIKFNDNVLRSKADYLHFSYLKKSSWRKDNKIREYYDYSKCDKVFPKLPDYIINDENYKQLAL